MTKKLSHSRRQNRQTRTNITAARHQELMSQMAGAPKHGELITFRATGPHSYAAVVQALQESGLDPAIAKTFLPENAFLRAAKKMSEDRTILEVDREGDELWFQFTKAFFKKREVTYRKECLVCLNRSTGEISCDDQKIKDLAQKVLNETLEERTTSDVTNIVKKLFKSQSELIPDPCQDGIYFVPNVNGEFTEKIRAFLGKLGGRISRWPILAGSAEGDRTVQESVTVYMQGIVDELTEKVKTFGDDTRSDVLARAAEAIKENRTKLEAYAMWLGEKAQELGERVGEINVDLAKRIEEVAKRKIEAPQPKKRKIGDGKTDEFGSPLGSNEAKVNAVMNGVVKSFKEIVAETGLTRGQVRYSHLDRMVAEGWFERTPKGWRLKQA